MTRRPFRFGVEIQRPFDGRSWADTAREVEDLGYSTLCVPDHVHQGWGPIAAMTAAACATTSLRVAPMVLACDLRNPVVLAKELATIDLVSAGRLEVGLGAGYAAGDYRATGVPFDPPGVRVERLAEHAQVLRALFDGGPVRFDGRHHHVDAPELVPLPFRPGGPPLLVAGAGPRLLRTAARVADIVGIVPSAAGRGEGRERDVAAGVDAQVQVVRDTAGERFADLEVNAWVSVAAVTDDPEEAAAPVARRFGMAPAEVLASPLVLAGSVDAIVEALLARRDRWAMSYVTVPGPSARELGPVVARLTGA